MVIFHPPKMEREKANISVLTRNTGMMFGVSVTLSSAA
jgi:hypothetical protein